MLLDKVLIIELVAVDGFAPCTITPCEVSSLEHEFCDHSVELGTLVAKALLSRTQGPEVLCSPWNNLIVEFKLNPAKWASIHVHIEEDLGPASLTKCKRRQKSSKGNQEPHGGSGSDLLRSVIKLFK